MSARKLLAFCTSDESYVGVIALIEIVGCIHYLIREHSNGWVNAFFIITGIFTLVLVYGVVKVS